MCLCSLLQLHLLFVLLTVRVQLTSLSRRYIGDEVKLYICCSTMATHGTMSEFKPAGKESRSNYTERLGHYFVANKVTDAEQKRAILLSACGPATFKLIKSLSDPAKLPTMTFAEISALVKDYYQPTPSEIVQRFKFNTRTELLVKASLAMSQL